MAVTRPKQAQSHKSPQAFRTISEVSEILDVPAHVLRFWESKFSQLRPMKSSGGRRYYRPEDVDLLRGIRELLYVDGLTIKGVQKIFREQGQKAVMRRGREDQSTGNPAIEAEADSGDDLWSDDDLVEEIAPPAQGGTDPARIAMIRDAVRRLEAVRARILRDLSR
ncbi:MAG: MerR family transcriptional regulator [Alphaproteobacteria bacterium]|nr:MAG: MerR family transcriptional regulator [Alphaproteobacteria bacterium]